MRHADTDDKHQPPAEEEVDAGASIAAAAASPRVGSRESRRSGEDGASRADGEEESEADFEPAAPASPHVDTGQIAGGDDARPLASADHIQNTHWLMYDEPNFVGRAAYNSAEWIVENASDHFETWLLDLAMKSPLVLLPIDLGAGVPQEAAGDP